MSYSYNEQITHDLEEFKSSLSLEGTALVKDEKLFVTSWQLNEEQGIRCSQLLAEAFHALSDAENNCDEFIYSFGQLYLVSIHQGNYSIICLHDIESELDLIAASARNFLSTKCLKPSPTNLIPKIVQQEDQGLTLSVARKEKRIVVSEDDKAKKLVIPVPRPVERKEKNVQTERKKEVAPLITPNVTNFIQAPKPDQSTLKRRSTQKKRRKTEPVHLVTKTPTGSLLKEAKRENRLNDLDRIDLSKLPLP